MLQFARAPRRFFSCSLIVSCSLILALALAPSGCSDDAQPPARDGAGLEARAPDAGDDRGAGLDSGRDRGPAGCQAGIGVAPLVLASGYCVGARIALPSSLALAIDASTLWTAENGPAARHFVVRARSLDLAAGALGQPLDVFSWKVSGNAKLFGGQYLASWPATGRLAVGYTLEDQNGAIWAGGGGATPMEIAAKGNYDALYLDAETLLINGLGAGGVAEGPAVYVFRAGAGRRLVKDIGSYSGFMARGDRVVYLGGFTTQNEVWAFTTTELRAAITAQSTLSAPADGDLVHAGPVIDAAALGDDLLVIDDDYVAFKALRRIAVTVAGDKVAKATLGDVLTPGTDTSIKPSEVTVQAGWIGLRLSGGSADELALLRAE